MAAPNVAAADIATVLDMQTSTASSIKLSLIDASIILAASRDSPTTLAGKILASAESKNIKDNTLRGIGIEPF